MTILRVVSVAVALLAIARSASARTAQATGDASITSDDPPAAAATSPSDPLVAVHILEKFNPFVTKTIVGTYSLEETPDFRIMFSFKAFAFNEASAMAANCYGVLDDGHTWKAISTYPFQPRPATEPAFCVRRDTADDDPESFVVAQFPAENPANAPIVLWAKAPLANLSADARNRGWLQPPLASFRVHSLQVWQTVPVLPLVTDVAVVSVDRRSDADALCPSDPEGRVVRKLEGGNFYNGVSDARVLMLCVSYVQRSLHHIDPNEQFFFKLRLVVKMFLRLNMCPLVADAVQDVTTDDDALLTTENDDNLLLCYQLTGLLEKKEEEEDEEDGIKLLKRVTINEEEEDRAKRVQIEHHGTNAWALPNNYLDPSGINANF